MKTTSKLIAAGALALSGLAAGTTQASASQSANNCTLTALRPQVNGQYVRAQATLSCGATRFVSAQAALMEDDPTSDDTVNMSNWGGPWQVAAGTRIPIYGPWVRCPNTELGAEELYSKVRVIVTGNSTITTPWDVSLVQPFSC